jgi:hypothetical protein
MVVLILGMGLGEFLYWRGTRRSVEDDGPSLYDSREYQRDVQMYVGTLGLIIDQWERAVSSPGAPGVEVAVAAVVAAGACFWMASRLPRE